jgi:hypothetical protein
MYRIDIEGDIIRFPLDSLPIALDCLASLCFPECARRAKWDSEMNGMNMFCAVDFRGRTLAISIMLVILLNSMKPAGKLPPTNAGGVHLK